jgi:hypothetical protein
MAEPRRAAAIARRGPASAFRHAAHLTPAAPSSLSFPKLNHYRCRALHARRRATAVYGMKKEAR